MNQNFKGKILNLLCANSVFRFITPTKYIYIYMFSANHIIVTVKESLFSLCVNCV